MITQIAGVRGYRQNGTDILLRPGDSTLIDSGRPWSSSCGTDCVRLYLRVPRWMMEERLRRREIPIAQRISANTGMGATLYRLSLCLYEEAEWIKGELGGTSIDSYFEILACCLSADDGLAQHGPQPSARVLEFIDAHVSEPTLSPGAIASAMGISVRHLHRLFSTTGNTLGDHIRTRRLDHCRRDLANPHLREKTITDIAFSWGFSDAAHFSHSFKKQFGVSPRVFRAQAMTNERGSETRELMGDFLRPELSKFRQSRPN